MLKASVWLPSGDIWSNFVALSQLPPLAVVVDTCRIRSVFVTFVTRRLSETVPPTGRLNVQAKDPAEQDASFGMDAMEKGRSTNRETGTDRDVPPPEKVSEPV